MGDAKDIVVVFLAVAFVSLALLLKQQHDDVNIVKIQEQPPIIEEDTAPGDVSGFIEWRIAHSG